VRKTKKHNDELDLHSTTSNEPCRRRIAVKHSNCKGQQHCDKTEEQASANCRKNLPEQRPVRGQPEIGLLGVTELCNMHPILALATVSM